MADRQIGKLKIILTCVVIICVALNVHFVLDNFETEMGPASIGRLIVWLIQLLIFLPTAAFNILSYFVNKKWVENITLIFTTIFVIQTSIFLFG